MGSTPTNPPLVVIVGETASGKTAAAIKIAQKLGGEIICADSRTVYKQMDIGTAKPTKEEQRLVPHHLLDIIYPHETFSAAQFQRRANKCIQDIHGRGKVPVMVGGTGLYVDSVLYDFQFADAPDPRLRAQLEQMNDEELTTLLHTKNIDTIKLNTKNRRHVIRAIEREGKAPVNDILRKNTLVLGLKLDRELLKRRITVRVQQMFANGFLDEVRQLEHQYGGDVEALKAPGYKAATAYLRGDIDLEAAQQQFARSDLLLAKRQRTWFKRNPAIQWFDDPGALITQAVEFVGRFDYNT